MNENLSFQENDEISEQAVNTFVENVILEAKISLAHIIITVQSTSSVTAQEEVIILAVTDRNTFRA